MGLTSDTAPGQQQESPPVQAAPLAPVLRLYPALTNPAFRLLWLGMLPATLAWQMSMIVNGYAAFVLSGSATVLGVVSIATGLPMIPFALVGGVVADRLSRRTVLLGTQGTFVVATGAIAALSLAGWLQVWHLVAYALFQGVAISFNVPARQSFIAELVGPQLVRNAIALNNAGMNCCRIAGPALAGALQAAPAVGVAGALVAMAAMYVVVVAALLGLPARAETSAPAAEHAGGWAEMLEGLRYIQGSPVLLALMGLALVPLCFGLPYQTLMPLFAEEVFAVGAGGLGALMTANGLGALAGSLAVAAVSGYSRPGVLQLRLGVGFGLALVGFGLAPAFPIALACLAVVGFTSAAYSALNNSLVMAHTEPRLYGRVMSVYLLTFAVMPIGSLPAAWLADHVGGPATVVGGGLAVAVLVVGVAILYRPYRQIR